LIIDGNISGSGQAKQLKAKDKGLKKDKNQAYKPLYRGEMDGLGI